MPKMNIFGELEYSKEELKEIERQKAEEAKRLEEEKRAEEEAKAKAKELKKQIKAKRDDIDKKLDKLIEKAEDDESLTSLENAKGALPDLNTLQELDAIWNPFDAKYNAMLAIEKQQEKEKKEKEAEANAKKYKYPFQMYFGHEYRDVSGVFEEGKEYTEKQLTKILIEHGYKEFKYAQEIQWEYFEDENCLFPKFKLGNRG